MASTRNPLQVLKEAKQIAKDNNCFVVEKPEPKGTRYLIYRKLFDRNECVGTAFTPDALRKRVCKVTGFR